MGQVLDEIVEEWMGTDDSEIKEQLDRIENKLGESDGNNSHTHTSENKVDSELKEKVENREEIDPDRWDLTVFKGDTEMVVDAGIGVLKHQKEDTETISKKDVMNMVQSQFDYSINAARQKRDLILDELGPVFELDGVLDELIDMEIIENLNKKTKGNSEHYGKEDEYRGQYKNLNDYLEMNLEFNAYVINQDKYKEKLLSSLRISIDTGSSKQINARRNSFLNRIDDRIEDEPVIPEY
jgi:hypothetical protein